MNASDAKITIRNTEGTMKIDVAVSSQKIVLGDVIRKIVETGELKRHTSKANAFRKTTCDILRYELKM